RTVEQGCPLPKWQLTLPAGVSSATGVHERVLGRVEHRRPATTDELRPGRREPRLSQSHLVTSTCEDWLRLFGESEQRRARLLAGLVLAVHQTRDPRRSKARAELAGFVAGSRCPGRRLRCQLICGRKLAGDKERLSEVEPECYRWIAVRPHRERPPK